MALDFKNFLIKQKNFNKRLNKQCPICFSRKYKSLIFLEIPSFDQLFTYKFIRLASCNKCGHIYNILSKTEQKNILNFYTKEFISLSEGKTKNYVLEKRTDDCFKILKKHCNYSSKILDLGCGDGYMLKFLYKKGYKNLSGLDILPEKKKYKYCNRISGNIEKLPYKSSSFDLILLEQVFEHSVNPRKVLQEAFRVTKLNGKIVIGIPNAAKYSASQLFPFYMIIMKEHIQHFDLQHIKMLSRDLDAHVLETKETTYPLRSMNMPCSNLYIVLQKKKLIKKKLKNKFLLRTKMAKYLKQSNNKLNFIAKKLSRYSDRGKTIYFWGIGREFFLIYSMLKYKKKKIYKFIDSNKRIHKKKINGIEIRDKSCLKKINQDNAVIVVTAGYHFLEIQKYLKNINFAGDIVKIF